MAIGTTAAIIGSAVLGAGASVVAGKNNSNAIAKSTDSSLQANREAIAAQERAFQQQLAYQTQSRDMGMQLQTDTLNSTNALQTDAFNANGQRQTQQYNNAVGTFNPFMQTGYAAMNGLNAMLGLPQQKAFTSQRATFTPIEAQQVTAPTAPQTQAAPTAQPTQQATMPAQAAPQAAMVNPAEINAFTYRGGY